MASPSAAAAAFALPVAALPGAAAARAGRGLLRQAAPPRRPLPAGVASPLHVAGASRWFSDDWSGARLRQWPIPSASGLAGTVGMSAGGGNGNGGVGGGGGGGGGGAELPPPAASGGSAAATTTAAAVPPPTVRLPTPQGAVAAEVPDDELSFLDRAAAYAADGRIPPSAAAVLVGWHSSYAAAAATSPAVAQLLGSPRAFTDHAFATLLELVRTQTATPAAFEPHHVAVRSPFDYYAFGLTFCLAMVDLQASRVLGAPALARAMRNLAAGDNVIFLANHQSEADPHAIALVLANVATGVTGAADLGARMLFMAGDRVREDSVAAPFSLGFNMLTVYSKKHIRDVPDQVDEKVRHNRVTAGVTASLFKEGGSAVWFAPSGGRDRRCGASGRVEVAAFDPAAVEMMRLTAAKSGTRSHFYPMALTTYAILPPPTTVDVGVGEARVVDYTGVGLAVGEEVDWEGVEAAMSPDQRADKKEGRRLRAAAVQEAVEAAYARLGGYEQ